MAACDLSLSQQIPLTLLPSFGCNCHFDGVCLIFRRDYSASMSRVSVRYWSVLRAGPKQHYLEIKTLTKVHSGLG
jgi:hypothetical protein